MHVCNCTCVIHTLPIGIENAGKEIGGGMENGGKEIGGGIHNAGKEIGGGELVGHSNV